MTWVAFYVVLSLAVWLPLWPMLRGPRVALKWDTPELAFDVPVTTFDSRGF